MATAIYLRVSTKKQDTRSQEADLTAWAQAEQSKGEEVTFYRDKASGKNFERPGWDKLYRGIQTGRISRLVVWRLDRLGRLVGQTITLLDELEEKDIRFISLRDGIDSTTPAGRLMRNVLASVAAYETEVRSERQRAGIDAAKAAGKTWGGRKPGTVVKAKPEKVETIQRMVNDGKSISEISRVVGLGRQTIYRILGKWQRKEK